MNLITEKEVQEVFGKIKTVDDQNLFNKPEQPMQESQIVSYKDFCNKYSIYQR